MPAVHRIGNVASSLGSSIGRGKAFGSTLRADEDQLVHDLVAMRHRPHSHIGVADLGAAYRRAFGCCRFADTAGVRLRWRDVAGSRFHLFDLLLDLFGHNVAFDATLLLRELLTCKQNFDYAESPRWKRALANESLNNITRRIVHLPLEHAIEFASKLAQASLVDRSLSTSLGSVSHELCCRLKQFLGLVSVALMIWSVLDFITRSDENLVYLDLRPVFVLGSRQKEEGLDVKVAQYVGVGHVVQADLSALCQFALFEESDALPVFHVLEIARRLGHGGP